MQVVPLPVASYNLMPAPRYWAGKGKPGIRPSTCWSRWEFSSPVQVSKYCERAVTYPWIVNTMQVKVGRRASPPSHDEPDALERHI